MFCELFYSLVVNGNNYYVHGQKMTKPFLIIACLSFDPCHELQLFLFCVFITFFSSYFYVIKRSHYFITRLKKKTKSASLYKIHCYSSVVFVANVGSWRIDVIKVVYNLTLRLVPNELRLAFCSSINVEVNHVNYYQVRFNSSMTIV